jgi:methylated-DNA-protein-cysteine methyltransferase-like protein
MMPEIDLPPNFNPRVYALVRLIPPGKVLSYGQVAALLNVPQGARAVGWAMHSCPNDVPWQRVVNAQGKISPRGNKMAEIRQRELLEAEGIAFDDKSVIAKSYFWKPSPFEILDKLDSDEAGL